MHQRQGQKLASISVSHGLQPTIGPQRFYLTWVHGSSLLSYCIILFIFQEQCWYSKVWILPCHTLGVKETSKVILYNFNSLPPSQQLPKCSKTSNTLLLK